MLVLNTHNFTMPDSCDVKVMTFNTNLSADYSEGRCQQLIELVKKENPDILCLQEVSIPAFNRIKEPLDSLFAYEADNPIRGDRLRYYLYSKYKINSLNRHRCIGDLDTTGFSNGLKKSLDLFRLQMCLYSADIEIKNRPTCIFSCHLMSSAYSTARRSIKKNSCWVEGIPLYYKYYVTGKRFRDYEAQNVHRYVGKAFDKGAAVILVGDMNDWIGSDCMDILQGEDDYFLKDAWCEGGNGLGFTYFGWHLRLRLDHILYSKDFQLSKVKVVDSDLSDHKPLVASFIIK